MYALLRSSTDAPTEEEVEDTLAGNLCRCTGYRPILEGFRTFAKTSDAAYGAEARSAAGAPPALHAPPGGVICPSTGRACEAGCGVAGPAEASPHQLTRVREPIFPPELRRRAAGAIEDAGPVATWHRPSTLAALLSLVAKHPHARIVGGNSEVGIEARGGVNAGLNRTGHHAMAHTFSHSSAAALLCVQFPQVKFKQVATPVLISPCGVDELTDITREAGGSLRIGGAATLTSLEHALHAAAADLPPSACSGFDAIRRQLRWFAGRQIRNVATVGGNVCTGSPISDLNPLWRVGCIT